jgi:hypothetical protein
VERGSIVYLQARQQREGRTVQRLSISIVDTRLAQKAVTSDSVKDLSTQLRDAALRTSREEQIPLRSLTNRHGYYFIATDTDRSAPFTQYAEGAILHAGYLINFTLHTNDASSTETQEMLSALDQLRIE